MKRIIMAVMLATMICLAPGVSRAATIIFSDDFTSESPDLNYASFANWTVSDGTVDMIGFTGFFDLFNPPGDQRYVDMDGTTNNAGIMVSNALTNITGGVLYDLTFEYAGSQRGDVNDLTYGIDLDNDGFLEHSGSLLLVASNVPFTPVSLPFTPAGTDPYLNARIYFSQNQVGGDNIGLLLDNVKVSTEASLPEPASLMLLGAGLAGIGIWRRKAKV
jgi:PEP-CTERM motif